jgi:acetyltransferase-like isoleucine patch superfamily enzyme
MSQQSAQPVQRPSSAMPGHDGDNPAHGDEHDEARRSDFVARRPPLIVRVVRRLRDDVAGTRFGLIAVQLLVSLIPRLAFGWLRAILYRAVGVRIGPSSYVFGKIEIEGVGDVLANVRIGESCLLTTPLYLNASGCIDIADRVTLGHHVMIITDNHRMTDPSRRGGERISSPVKIEDGVWVGARVTILPGVTLGSGCVVAAGAVVAHDVAPHTLVGGVPARHISDLER